MSCFNTEELTAQTESMPLTDHCWSICNIEDCNGNWVTPSAPWIAGQLYGPFAFQSNPLNPNWIGTWTAQSPEFDAFHAWVVSQVGTLNVGDTIKFDMIAAGTMCNILGTCANSLCFKYEGYLNWSNGFGYLAPTGIPTVTLDNCCSQTTPLPISTPCINPLTSVNYQIGDTGPGGGIIFSIPGQGNNNTKYYFEVAEKDVSTTQRAQMTTQPGLHVYDCNEPGNSIPGAEFGVYKEIILPSDNSQLIGDGSSNTIHLNSYPTSFGGVTPNPTNPVLDIHDLAAMLCVDYVGPNGHTDWFLPSLREMLALASNLSPTSVFNNVANIANLYTSVSHPASAFYWTSSVLAGPPGTVFDTIAAGVNVVTGTVQIMDRCSTGSVRPVRMFECPTLQPSVPVVDNSIESTSINPGVLITKSTYDHENQDITVKHWDNIIDVEESTEQTVVTFSDFVSLNSRKNIFGITFKAKDNYYYPKNPSAITNFTGSKNYKIKTESEIKNANGYIIEKTFIINYKNTGFDILESGGHNIIFTNKTAKEVSESTKTKEITALNVDTSSISGIGESRNISVVGTPGSTFSLTIKDKNGRNVLPYSNRVTKIIKTAASDSATLKLNNATGLEVGMVLLNNQRRNVKITGISDPITTNVDAINQTSTTYISVSSSLTFAADTSITFVKEGDITEVAIPDSGSYSFIQEFPILEKFKRTLKTAASSTTSLTLDYNNDLENDMRITGTGVDGNNPTIGLTKLSTTVGVLADGVTISASDAQTIADETELTFEMPDNRYDITLYPLMAILRDGIPTYSSTDCDTLPTYSVYQYIDPIVEIAPSSALSNVTTAGTVTFTGKANRTTTGTSGDIAISMTATKSDGNLAVSREPRFSSTDSTLSDFSNTLNSVTKIVREGDCNDRDIVHLNNITGIRVGMVITGESINNNKTITVKSITGTAVKLSEKQTIQKDEALVFSSMCEMHIRSLTATLSANGGLTTGICTVAGTGKITTFGVDSFTSTFDFDNFLSIVSEG